MASDQDINSEITPEGWTTAPTLEELKSDFDLTKYIHEAQVSKIYKWLHDIRPEEYPEDRVGTNQKSPFAHQYTQASKAKNRSKIKSKLIRKQAEWRYTSLSEPFLNTPDIYNADPVTFEDVAAAEQNQLVLNNQINTKLSKVAFIDEYVRTCNDEGTVIVKTGWNYQFEMVSKEYPVFEIRPATEQRHINVIANATQIHPDAMPQELREAMQITQQTGIPHYPFQTGVEIVEEEKATANHPTWDICHFENVRIDPTCNGEIDKAQFVVYSFEANKSELEKQNIYSNLDKIKDLTVNGTPEHESNWDDSGFEFNDEARKKFVVYEYWGYWDVDDSGKTTPIVASWVGNTLIRLEESPMPDKCLPFVAVPFMPVKDSVYGETDGSLLKENQDIEGALKRGFIDLFGRSANAQTGIKKGALDVINRRRFERGQDYEFNDVGDAQNSIHMHTFPEVPQSVYNFLTMQNQEAESLTGVLAFNQGVSGTGLGSTAAAANGALSAAARRELGILRRLAEGMKQIGHKFIAMNQAFLSEEEVIRVTNKDFVTVRRDDLAGKFDIRLSISTAEADEQKAQELSFMLQTTAQSMGMDFTKLILGEIADLRKMPHLAQQIKSFEPKPDPYQVQLQQLELAEKQAEIQKTQAEVQKILAEAQLSGTKATDTQADTDQKNLDYVEQEAGIKHARDVDLMETQAEAQANTKVVEAALSAVTDVPNETDNVQ